jgi:hypothetical protein
MGPPKARRRRTVFLHRASLGRTATPTFESKAGAAFIKRIHTSESKLRNFQQLHVPIAPAMQHVQVA